MKTSNNLHQLIRSLSKSEKAYIKKYAISYSKTKNNYSILLEAVAKQETYDEHALLLKFRKESFVKHFAVTKNQLFELILKLLRQYNQESNPGALIHAAIESSKILYERGLIASCLKQLDKAYKLATDYADYAKLDEILDWKRHCIGQLKANNWEFEIEQLLQEKEDLAKSEVEHVFYARVYYKMLFLVRKYYHIRTESQLKELQEVLPDGNLPPIQYSNHFYTQLHFWNIKNIYCFLTEDFLAAQDYMEKIVQLWEQHPKIRQKETERYIAALNNYANSAFVTKDWGIIARLIDKMNQINPESFRLKAVIFENMVLWQSSAHSHLGKHKEFFLMLPEIEQSLMLYKDSIHEVRHLLIQYVISRTHIFWGNYSQSLDHVNKLLDMKQIHLREDIQLFANMLFFWLQYRLGNFIFLENALINYTRKVKKNGLLNDLEELQLKYLLKLTRTIDVANQLKQLQLFEKALHQLVKQKPSLAIIIENYLDLDTWIESLRQDTTMQEIVEKKKR